MRLATFSCAYLSKHFVCLSLESCPALLSACLPTLPLCQLIVCLDSPPAPPYLPSASGYMHCTHLHAYLPIYLHPSAYPPTCLPTCPPTNQPTYVPTYRLRTGYVPATYLPTLPTYMTSICLSACLSLFICLSVCLSVGLLV